MNHDPLCPALDGLPVDDCQCDLIARARASQRADLRFKVAGLPIERRSARGVALLERVRVLALLDGEIS